ncbi:hypothetical protein PHSY_001742 [Pseudozyma hubeiensis SY62]|uniref:F-box domain-containing protein n=1 Tax=Pseudozyma hubeiensis (strain SY62) TaxID=1305764 RepID=R9NZG9_PSEHS|nr:hypothetical protein PHSY_001742 [Pseudozyma hubeiensis SY62]GAC94171.1 hypothetical protein PHSY_001742 [Pseudozyma hubeiensis SY62]
MQSLFEQLRHGDAPAEDGDQSELTLEDFDLASLRRIRVVADEITTELDALNALHRDDFESADMYHRVRYAHAHRHSKLRKEHRRLLEQIGQGAHRHGMALGSDMEKRQKKAEGVSDTAMIEIFKRDNEVASHRKAWDSNDFEQVVELASQRIEALAYAPSLYDYEGVQELCSNLQRRSEAYHAMKLVSLALADLKRAYELVTETTGFHRHTEAHIAKNSDLEASHIGGLEIAAHKTKRSAGDALDDRAFKRQRQIREQSQTPSAGFLSLSLELLLNISEWFDPADRIRLANTCRELRRVPHLWQQLVFKRIKQTLRVGWHRDTIEACVAAIETCQRRSHGTLTSVVLKGYILPDMLGPIFKALRSNPLSLQYLAIPTMQQELCYRELYRLCPNLLGVDIRINARHSSDGVLYGLVSRHSLGPSTSLFPSTPMPF